MNTIEFSASEIYVKVGSSWSNRNSLALSIETDKIISVQDLRTTVGSIGLASLTFIKDNDEVTTITVNIDADGVYAFKALSTVGEIMSAFSYTRVTDSWVTGRNGDLWINAEHLSTVAPTNFYAGRTRLYTLAYITAFAQKVIYTTEAIANAFSKENNTKSVVFHPSTQFVYANELSLCYDVQTVNHETGVSNIFHTPHLATAWVVDSQYNVTPYGGFLKVFRSNDYSRYFLYFFDNDGNLIDQIDGFGPGYQWGNLSQRLVYGIDNDPDGSLVKIFDGENIRTHEFPGLCTFLMDPFSEGDCTKNLYVPFLVYSVDDDREYLYLSAPDGSLTQLDHDSWFNNESFSALHPSSSKIIRMTRDNSGNYDKLEMYNEQMSLTTTLNLSGKRLNDYDTREYYGSNGNFYLSLYNWDDDTVPYMIISANANTSKFETFELANNGTLTLFDSDRDYDIYDSYSSKSANSITVLAGISGASPALPGLVSFQSGAKIYWTSPTTGKWFSYTVNGTGAEVQISLGEARYGTYPMYIICEGFSSSSKLYYLVLNPDGTVVYDSLGIELSQVLGLSTFAMGDLTVANIDLNAGSLVEWRFFDNTGLVDSATTSNLFSWYINGATFALVDTTTPSNSFAFTPSTGLINSGSGFPTPNDNFLLESSQWGADYPIFGYNNNGAQVLVDRDVLGNIDGFYFLTENSNGWVHVINEYNDTAGAITTQAGNKHFLYVCEESAGNYYAMVYDMTTGAMVSGVKVRSVIGPVNTGQVGDRMWMRQNIGGDVYEQYYFTNKGVVQLQYDGSIGQTWYSYNDAEWSWD